jgi:hypothetical protein
MATVKFNDLSEFLTELKLVAEKIEGKILRLTCGHRSEYPMTALSVLATALVGNVVLRLENRCGSYLMSESHEAEQVREAVKSGSKLVETAATELGLEVRAGTYES